MLAYNAYTACPQPRPSAASRPAAERSRGEQLLAEIEAFMRQHPRMTRNSFGREAVNNNKLVDRLEQGLDPKPVTVRRVRAFIEGYRG